MRIFRSKTEEYKALTELYKLLKKGWVQGVNAATSEERWATPVAVDSPRAKAFCLYGGVVRVTILPSHKSKLRQKLIALLRQATPSGCATLTSYNDTHTKQQVLNLVKRAREHT